MHETLLQGCFARKKPRDKSAGFTLTELIIVLAIIGALMTIAIPIYNGYINKARITLAYDVLDTVRLTLESFHIDNHEYPDTIDFTTGKDNLGRTVFHAMMLEQIDDDLASVDSYVRGVSTYTLIVKANDGGKTVMTLTPTAISY